MPTSPDVPRADEPPPLRVDAQRNRARVLAAAEALFAERDPRTVTMEDVARRAEVGKGTLYRRFPSIGELAEALLDEHERVLQGRIISGPPPLGPGSPPAERLAAFYAGMVALLEQHAHLVLGSEIGGARFTTGAFRFWRLHVSNLVDEAGVEDPFLPDAILAPLAPDVFLHARAAGLTAEQIAESLRSVAARLLG